MVLALYGGEVSKAKDNHYEGITKHTNASYSGVLAVRIGTKSYRGFARQPLVVLQPVIASITIDNDLNDIFHPLSMARPHSFYKSTECTPIANYRISGHPIITLLR